MRRIQRTRAMVAVLGGGAVTYQEKVLGIESANLIAYWPQATITPAVAFADLINAGALVYVTGFDGGSQYFDPNGPAFLNTLTQVRNGFGYWVKVNGAWPGFQYEACGVAGHFTGDRRCGDFLFCRRPRGAKRHAYGHGQHDGL